MGSSEPMQARFQECAKISNLSACRELLLARLTKTFGFRNSMLTIKMTKIQFLFAFEEDESFNRGVIKNFVLDAMNNYKFEYI